LQEDSNIINGIFWKRVIERGQYEFPCGIDQQQYILLLFLTLYWQIGFEGANRDGKISFPNILCGEL
jgi:hypothetical protein